ncbi:Short-chain dehydrogenase/reductase SDR [Lasiodiplodia theobromae]|uniref:Short-chain dehydrogenase/reductase tropG n=1 Tax=Lasiodiplodia theobromae TaxID=45133 RepID=A0A5N5DMZ3_9PEZI|nr:Short-chain dehydrogenase/reductase SDR [Lasiodiplodia theobromae]KAB2579289.1 Short-chain dehydrogenase/reductase tropG [Lasiodiplodia theobromae]KAF4537304.1 Short-chain dehydrogenase/reductase SDR [Lasiodiplodia theobromae]
MSGFLRLLRDKWSPPRDPTTSLAGRTILITGASTGLGLEAAIKCAQLGCARLVLGVRDAAAKGEKTKQTVQQRAQRKRKIATREATGDCVIDVWEVDFLDFESVEQFAERVASELERLDAAVLNAGVSMKELKRSKHGWEETLQVNVLGTALLGLLLLPVLKKSNETVHDGRPPVLEIVGSSLYRHAKLGSPGEKLLEKFNREEGFNGRKQYGISKALVMYAMRSLAAMDAYTEDGKDVVVMSASPGFCKSDLRRHYTGAAAKVFGWLFYAIFAREAEEGARSLVSAVCLGEEAHDGFWHSDKLLELDPMLMGETGEKMRQQIWHEIVDAVRRDVPEALELTQNGRREA